MAASEILGESFRLYRAHAKVFLAAAAIALVPIYIVHAGLAAALLPASSVTSRLDARSERLQRRSAELQQKAAAGKLSPAEAIRAQEELLADASESARDAGGAVVGLGAFLLSLIVLVPLSVLGTFFGTAALVPLVEDRARGGSLSPAGAWQQVGARAAPLAITGLMAAAVVLAGLFVFVVPGLVLGFLFAFAAPMVMLGGESGVGALRSSARMVIAHLVPTALVLLALVVLGLVARFIGGLLVPSGWVFVHTLVRDVVSLLIFPLPVIGLVLLYKEARQPARPSAPQQLGQPLPVH